MANFYESLYRETEAHGRRCAHCTAAAMMEAELGFVLFHYSGPQAMLPLTSFSHSNISLCPGIHQETQKLPLIMELNFLEDSTLMLKYVCTYMCAYTHTQPEHRFKNQRWLFIQGMFSQGPGNHLFESKHQRRDSTPISQPLWENSRLALVDSN